jgi:hypothetical protein
MSRVRRERLSYGKHVTVVKSPYRKLPFAALHHGRCKTVTYAKRCSQQLALFAVLLDCFRVARRSGRLPE